MDPNHALLVGNVAGALMSLKDDISTESIDIPVDEKGNYTNKIIVKRASGTYIITVEKE